MRDLTKKQKVILKNWFDKNKEDLHGFDLIDDVPEDLWDTLVEIHDTEILYQTANNYLCDLLHG